MKLATTLPLTLLSTISLLPSASAWKLTWHDEDGKGSVESGKGPHSCIEIQHAQGERYVWDNQGNENIGIYFYTSSDCSGTVAGWSTDKWAKDASRDLLSFEVKSEGAKTTGTMTTTGSHTSSDDSSASATVTTSTGRASNSTESGSSSAVGSKTNPEASATASSSAESSNTASAPSSTETEQSGSSTPSPTASATDGASTDESAASSLSKNSAVQLMAGLTFGLAAFEWLF
ncbi:hypothetical protein P170DRAFT_433949 [Aspergillus steynii IBT 23096]|uniref:Uncharacterized protein n=1 Tax=Aspergillus steynii IBT 23096 TaxID=1392250 RepID=A0A2I2GGT2_9EURO|nr:uncharacterized protein P170DRAFT_433949 [Aspergillus steynii IBT 23096]PLB52096.1 hypothetical protein P170DRAFT_433949 [Aspergillus steynii IBT 23096]